MEISFEDSNGYGEYGLSDWFFNFITWIEEDRYYVQACAQNLNDLALSLEDVERTSFRDGICGDVNADLASRVGWDEVGNIIRAAIVQYVGSLACYMHISSGDVATLVDWSADFESMDIESFGYPKDYNGYFADLLTDGHLVEVNLINGEWIEA